MTTRHLAARRALLRARGRPMALRRQGPTPAASPAVALVGFARAYSPGELTAGVQQGDVRVEILNDEIAAASWPAPPRAPDRVAVDGRTYTVVGAFPIHEGAALIGYTLWCRGA